MHFIATNFPLGDIGGIYKGWIYSAGKIDGKLIIYRKKVTSLNEWEEFLDTDLILSNPVNCECSDGIPIASGVIGSSFVFIAKGQRNNVNGVHKFSVNLDTTEITDINVFIDSNEHNFQDLCNLCYQSNILPYNGDSEWILDSWKYKAIPHNATASGSKLDQKLEFKQWWSTNIQVIDDAKTECFASDPTVIKRLTGSYRIESNIGIIESGNSYIYFTDTKELMICDNARDTVATVSDDSDIKEWDDIGFWNFDGKLFALALKKVSETECEISSHQIVITPAEGTSAVQFIQKFSFTLDGICPNLHTSRFFVTSNVILLQDESGIITVTDEGGFDPETFLTKSKTCIKKEDDSKEVHLLGVQKVEVINIDDDDDVQIQENQRDAPRIIAEENQNRIPPVQILPVNPVNEDAGNHVPNPVVSAEESDDDEDGIQAPPISAPPARQPNRARAPTQRAPPPRDLNRIGGPYQMAEDDVPSISETPVIPPKPRKPRQPRTPNPAVNNIQQILNGTGNDQPFALEQNGVRTNFPNHPLLAQMNQNTRQPAAKVAVKPPQAPRIQKAKPPAVPKPRKQSVNKKLPATPRNALSAAAAKKNGPQPSRKATPRPRKRKSDNENIIPKTEEVAPKIRKVSNKTLESNTPISTNTVSNMSASLSTPFFSFSANYRNETSSTVSTPTLRLRKSAAKKGDTSFPNVKSEPTTSASTPLLSTTIKKEPTVRQEPGTSFFTPSSSNVKVKTEPSTSFSLPQTSKQSTAVKVKQEINDSNVRFDF